MPRHAHHLKGPPPGLIWFAGVSTTLVVVTAYLRLTYVARAAEASWTPIILRWVVAVGMWSFMLFAYIRASLWSIRIRSWWLFSKGLALILLSMLVLVLYSMFVNVHAWR